MYCVFILNCFPVKAEIIELFSVDSFNPKELLENNPPLDALNCYVENVLHFFTLEYKIVNFLLPWLNGHLIFNITIILVISYLLVSQFTLKWEK